MKLFLAISFLFLIPSLSFADSTSGFYSGVDLTKVNPKSVSIDNSISPASKNADNKYYGYKICNRGFFVAPELLAIGGGQSLAVKNLNTVTGTAKPVSATPTLNYNVKANVGYEFNHRVTGFVTYDVGSVSYDPTQKSVGASNAMGSAVGVGSQFNFSNDLGLKIICSQEQVQGGDSSGSSVKSNSVKFGTMYKF